MKRLAVLACAMSLAAVSCNKSINPVVPSGVVTLVAQLAGTSNVPPAGSLEAGATGSLQVTLTPVADGSYTASFALSLKGLVKSGVLPAPLDNGSVIVAGYIHQGAAGTLGAPVASLPISQAAPILSPTGTVLITISKVSVTSSAASAILANPSRVLLQPVLGAQPERRAARATGQAVESPASLCGRFQNLRRRPASWPPTQVMKPSPITSA